MNHLQGKMIQSWIQSTEVKKTHCCEPLEKEENEKGLFATETEIEDDFIKTDIESTGQESNVNNVDPLNINCPIKGLIDVGKDDLLNTDSKIKGEKNFSTEMKGKSNQICYSSKWS